MADEGPWDVILRINGAWQCGEIDAVADLFHPDVVIVHPGFDGRTEGREACLESYRAFGREAKVLRLDELDPQVDIVGRTAVVTYEFKITYEVDGGGRHDAGRDVFVLVQSGERWRVVWRTLVLR